MPIITQITAINKEEMDLLLLADPSITNIEKYINKGFKFVLKEGNETLGILVLLQIDSDLLEIINIAVSEKHQRKGYSKYLLNFSKKFAKSKKIKTIEIGTANSSTLQLYIYQKAGFKIYSIDRDFFIINYKEKLYENGIQCIDMIRLRYTITDCNFIEDVK